MDEISQVTEKGVIAGLQKIDMNTPADSVQKAANKIRRAEQRSKGDSATSVSPTFWYFCCEIQTKGIPRLRFYWQQRTLKSESHLSFNDGKK